MDFEHYKSVKMEDSLCHNRTNVYKLEFTNWSFLKSLVVTCVVKFNAQMLVSESAS